MIKVHMVFKSGNEYRFLCEDYTLEKFQLNGDLATFSYRGVVGECPIFFRTGDVELIAIDIEDEEEDEE